MAVRQEETRKSEGRGEAREERASGGRCAPKDGERDDFSPDDERGREADGVSTGVESRGGGELDIYIGDCRLCTKRNPFKRRIPRTRPRRIRERVAMSAEGVRKLPRILHPVWRVWRVWSFPPPASGSVQLGKLCLDTPEGLLGGPSNKRDANRDVGRRFFNLNRV